MHILVSVFTCSGSLFPFIFLAKCSAWLFKQLYVSSSTRLRNQEENRSFSASQFVFGLLGFHPYTSLVNEVDFKYQFNDENFILKESVAYLIIFSLSLCFKQCEYNWDICLLSNFLFNKFKMGDQLPSPHPCPRKRFHLKLNYLLFSQYYGVSCCRRDFEVCTSAMSCLLEVSAQLQGIESLFLPNGEDRQAANQMALIKSLKYIQEVVTNTSADFTAWRTQLLASMSGCSGKDNSSLPIL